MKLRTRGLVVKILTPKKARKLMKDYVRSKDFDSSFSLWERSSKLTTHYNLFNSLNSEKEEQNWLSKKTLTLKKDGIVSSLLTTASIYSIYAVSQSQSIFWSLISIGALTATYYSFMKFLKNKQDISNFYGYFISREINELLAEELFDQPLAQMTVEYNIRNSLGTEAVEIFTLLQGNLASTKEISVELAIPETKVNSLIRDLLDKGYINIPPEC